MLFCLFVCLFIYLDAIYPLSGSKCPFFCQGRQIHYKLLASIKREVYNSKVSSLLFICYFPSLWPLRSSRSVQDCSSHTTVLLANTETD